MTRTKNQIKTNGTTNEIKGETTMTTKQKTTETQQIEQLVINAELAKNPKIEIILNALNKVDRANNYKTHQVRELLEIILYSKFIENNEEPNKAVNILLADDNFELYRAIASNIPYIVGLTSFGIDYNKSNSMLSIRATLKNPYGQYLQKLEDCGLYFNQRLKESEQIRNADQQQVIEEVNTLLQSVGLAYYNL